MCRVILPWKAHILYMFLWARNLLKKELMEEIKKSSFCALNLGLFANMKNYFQGSASETQFIIEHSCRLTNLNGMV